MVIPAALGLGLHPLPVALLGFLGNALPVLLIVQGHRMWSKYARSDDSCGNKQISRRRQRALNIWNKYGLVGLALLAPPLTGIHLATLLALAFQPGKRPLLLWMNASLAIWTVALVASVYYGLEGLGFLLG